MTGRARDSAERRFQDCRRLHPGGGPSRVLLERISAFRAVAPASDGNGVRRLDET